MEFGIFDEHFPTSRRFCDNFRHPEIKDGAIAPAPATNIRPAISWRAIKYGTYVATS